MQLNIHSFSLFYFLLNVTGEILQNQLYISLFFKLFSVIPQTDHATINAGGGLPRPPLELGSSTSDEALRQST